MVRRTRRLRLGCAPPCREGLLFVFIFVGFDPGFGHWVFPLVLRGPCPLLSFFWWAFAIALMLVGFHPFYGAYRLWFLPPCSCWSLM